MRRRIRVRSDEGKPVRVRLHLLFRDREGDLIHQEGRYESRDEFSYEDRNDFAPEGAVADPYEPGYWTAWEPDFRGADTIWCARINETGYSWWHAMLGRRIDDPQRGQGIRIGVIDAGFEPDDALGHLQEIDIGGDDVDEVRGRWIHGEVICRILGDAQAPRSCAPIAPGAELLFASATYSGMTRGDSSFRFPVSSFDPSSHLDPTLVINAIYEMALIHEVDLINLSSGAYGLPDTIERGITEAIETAGDAGVTLVCAAGNEFIPEADYPARLPDCIGVGAFGKEGWGAPGSVALEYNRPSSGGSGWWRDQVVFHWNESAYGTGVDTIGPGIGILVARDGVPAFDLSGTSFAAPIVAGALAVDLAEDETYLQLPPDRARLRYVKERLEALCQSGGFDREFEGVGIIGLE